MIEGLKVDVKSEEMVRLLSEQGEKHRKDASGLRATLEKLLAKANVKVSDAERELEELREFDVRRIHPGLVHPLLGLSSLKVKLQQVSRQIDNEESVAKHCEFIAAHLVKGETYRLQVNPQLAGMNSPMLGEVYPSMALFG